MRMDRVRMFELGERGGDAKSVYHVLKADGKRPRRVLWLEVPTTRSDGCAWSSDLCLQLMLDIKHPEVK